MNNPLISLIVCCYNRAHLLPQTMESAFAQTYRPIEIIVLDDGSEDETAQLMAGYGERINYHRQPNKGIAAARSRACSLAKGDYIAFLDDDDLIPEERINLLFSALQKNPQAVFAVGDLVIIDDEGKSTGKRWLPENSLGMKESIQFPKGDEAVLWPHVPAVPHTTLFRRDDGEKIGWFDQQYKFAAEDKDFFARLGSLGPVVYIPEIVSFYRRGHSSLTNNSMRTFYSQLLLFKNHLQLIDPQRKKFKRRLQWRILNTLKQMARNKEDGTEVTIDIPDNYLSNALSLLSLNYRIKYWMFIGKLFIRKSFSGRKQE